MHLYCRGENNSVSVTSNNGNKTIPPKTMSSENRVKDHPLVNPAGG